MTAGAKPKGSNNNRGFSRELFIDCPRDDIMKDKSVGWYFCDDFTDGLKGNWTLTQATAGTFTLADVNGGEAQLAAGSTTTAQGGQIQLTDGTGGAIFKPEAADNIWFECLVNFTGIANLNVETFLGLAEIDTTVIAAAAVSTANHVGYSSVTDDGVILANGEKAGAGDTNDPSYTITSGGLVKFGFKISGLTKVEFWINGVKKGSSINLAAANIPIVGLTPTFVCQSGGTDSPIMEIDWVEVWQEHRADISLQASA